VSKHCGEKLCRQTWLNFKLEFLSITRSEWDLDNVVAGQEDGAKWWLSTDAVIIRAVVIQVVAFHDEITTMP